MRIDNIIDVITEQIRQDSYFDQIEIIYAYPKAVKPTRLDKTYIALGISDINISPAHIDADDLEGNISVFADIFVPYKKENACLSEIFTRLCSCLSCLNLTSVSAGRIEAYADVQAYALKTVITFSDRITTGGEADE